MDWNEEPFIDYLNAVDDLLEQMYGLTTSDAGADAAAAAQEEGWTPEECVDLLMEEHMHPGVRPNRGQTTPSE